MNQSSTSQEFMVFKPDIIPISNWLNYGLGLVLLLIMIGVFIKYNTSKKLTTENIKIIEKKHLTNKTVVYVLKHQQQQFLLADNQHALTIYPLENRDVDDIL